VDVKKKSVDFAVFCGVLWCFAVFCVRVFLRFKKNRFSQNSTKRTKNIQNAQKTNKMRCVQYSAIRCPVHLSLTQKMSQKTFTKHVQKVAKHPQNAKHRKTLFFRKHSTLAKHRKTPAKHPQNTAKHHKTHLLTKQTELANKSLRSRDTVRYSGI